MQLQKPELIGKKAKCPGCKEPFIIQPIEDEAPKAAAAPTKKPAAASAASAATAPAAASTTKKPAAAAIPRTAKAAAPSAKSKPAAAAVAKAKPKQDIDFEVDDDEEILEAEVVEDDEDWLKGLDSLDPSQMGKRSARTSGAAPVVRKTVKKEVTKKKRKRRVRDADGELPLWMSRSITVAVGTVFGLITMAIWAGMIAKTGVPSRYMAVFIGATVGTGVRLGASKWDFGLFPAVTAALIALTAVIGGKVIGFNLMKRQAMESQAMEARYQLILAKHEDYPIHLMAEEIHREYRLDGIQDAQTMYDFSTELKTEADFATYYNPKRLPEIYGKDRWKGAKDRWDALPEAEKKEYQDQIKAEIENLTAVANMDVGAELQRDDKFRAAAGEGGGALNIFDFMFAAVAVIGAFKIAAGMADSAIDTSGGH